jgi:cytochrome c oxidase subunit 2
MMLALLAPLASLGRPVDASLDGFRSDTLFYVTTVMVTVLFVVMIGVLVWACVMHRQGRHQARYERGTDTRHLVYTALVTAIIAFGVDGTLLVDGYLDLDQALWRFPSADAHPLAIEVYAQQWSWNVRYAGPDGVFGTPDDVVTLDELHVPLDRPVIVKLKSKDVVHSFFLPNFRVKQDALPGVITRLWFQAKRAGVFELVCTQHCGVSHFKMRGLVTVEPAADFDAWLQARSDAAARAYDRDDVAAHWGWPWDA